MFYFFSLHFISYFIISTVHVQDFNNVLTLDIIATRDIRAGEEVSDEPFLHHYFNLTLNTTNGLTITFTMMFVPFTCVYVYTNIYFRFCMIMVRHGKKLGRTITTKAMTRTRTSWVFDMSLVWKTNFFPIHGKTMSILPKCIYLQSISFINLVCFCDSFIRK